jgi:hypothetical protein
VKGQLWIVINPGARGFVSTLHSKKEDATTGKRPIGMLQLLEIAQNLHILVYPEQVATSTAFAISNPKDHYN